MDQHRGACIPPWLFGIVFARGQEEYNRQEHSRYGKGEETMQVRGMMSTDIQVVDRNDHLRMVEERMAAGQLRHLPVVDQGALVGLVTQRDLFKAAMSSAMGYGEKAHKAFLQSVRVKEIMVSPVVTVTPETSVAEAADMMMQRGLGCLPVVEREKLVGIVTKTDLLRCLRTMSTGPWKFQV
jgi:CBS domain-containing protein